MAASTPCAARRTARSIKWISSRRVLRLVSTRAANALVVVSMVGGDLAGVAPQAPLGQEDLPASGSAKWMAKSP
ncbi:MAG: hypothetical protein ACRDHY_14080, partial [Anaerolineales bacterium]